VKGPRAEPASWSLLQILEQGIRCVGRAHDREPLHDLPFHRLHLTVGNGADVALSVSVIKRALRDSVTFRHLAADDEACRADQLDIPRAIQEFEARVLTHDVPSVLGCFQPHQPTLCDRRAVLELPHD
jgi:hypothetical protein